MNQTLSPKVDLAFKKLFGVEENQDLLIELINAILDPKDQVKEITILNPYNLDTLPQHKLSVLDIKARGNHGKQFNIEIQLTDQLDYPKRALYYWSKLYAEQLKKGENYDQLHKTIAIHLLAFVALPQIEDYHNVFHITTQNKPVHLFQDFELHTIEMAKYNQDPGQMIQQVQSNLEKWITFLNCNEALNSEQLPPLLSEPWIKKAVSLLEIMRLNEVEQDSYEARFKWIRLEKNAKKNCNEWNKNDMKKVSKRADKRAPLPLLKICSNKDITRPTLLK